MTSRAVLDGIEDRDDEADLDLLFGIPRYFSVTKILSSLPSRPMVDRGLSLYFNAKWVVFRLFPLRRN
jgi:hypothetical protein